MIEPFAPPAPMPAAGERILAAAEPLFVERGIRAVGVDTLAEAAGTTKKTLYDRFGSKDALVAAYLVRRARRWQAHLTAACAPLVPGREQALGVFDALGTWMAGSIRGCAFVNAYAEYGGTDPGGTGQPVIDIVRAEKRWMRDFFVATLVASDYPDAHDRAADLHLLYEGALVVVTAGADRAGIASARRAAAKALPPRPRDAIAHNPAKPARRAKPLPHRRSSSAETVVSRN